MEPDRWLGLELRHLVALKTVAEERSFGRAASKLGYTQSAISQQIATLERIVGMQLLDRPGGPKPVSLTEAGELLLKHAEAIAAQLQAVQADIAALAAGEAGPLRVGTYQSISWRLLPDLLIGFRREWPKVEIRLTESADETELLSLVERGDLDVTFTVLPFDPGPFEGVELLADPYVLVVQADSPLARRERKPTLREIVELPLINYRICRSTAEVESRLRASGHDPRIVFRSDDNGTIQGLVAAGMGAALVPRLTVDESDPRIAVLDLSDKVPSRLLAIAWHRDRWKTRAAKAFIQAAIDHSQHFRFETAAA
jgi:DNA-binding transcriptional LysR family regulator